MNISYLCHVIQLKYLMKFKTAVLRKESQTIQLKFPMENSNVLSKISAIPHAEMGWDAWEIPCNRNNIEILKRLDFELSTSLKDWNETIQPAKSVHIPENKNGLVLRDYQKQGVAFIEEKDGRALVADDMGLGKTIQALAWLQIHPAKRPVLIICPSILKENWKRETEKWVTNTHIEILNGQKAKAIPKSKNIIIVNYDILAYWITEIKKLDIQVIIADEAHAIKNNDAKRTKAFKKLSLHCPHVIGLTGTPIENRPEEIYNIVTTINANVFSNYYSFIVRYCGAKKNGFAGTWKTNGVTNVQELYSVLRRTVMIRRKKEDVLKELPPKQIVKIPIQIDNEYEYRHAEDEFIAFLRQKYKHITDEVEEELKSFAKRNKIEVGNSLDVDEVTMLVEEKIGKVANAPVLVQMEALKQLATKGKMNSIIEWIEEFLESGEKLVVFATHTKFIDQLIKQFPNGMKIDGSVSLPNRQKVIDEFQGNPKRNLIVAHILAGGVGITLTAASNVAIIEFPWSPSKVNQAIDRVHRISQLKQVTAWFLTSVNTIEEKIADLLKVKENMISQILDGKEVEDKSIVVEILKTYMK